MTIPVERTHAVLNTEAFLYRLLDPADTPRVPSRVRDEARRLLRHYPSENDMVLAASAAPSVFAVWRTPK